jgi:hypothetical protein
MIFFDSQREQATTTVTSLRGGSVSVDRRLNLLSGFLPRITLPVLVARAVAASSKRLAS